MYAETGGSLRYQFYLSRLRFRLMYFGNTLGFKVNFLYFLQHFISMLLAKGTRVLPDSPKFARELRLKGLIKVGKVDVAMAAKWADQYFGPHRPGSGETQVVRGAAAELAPEIFRILEEIAEPVLNAYYGSHFQFYWANLVRNETMESFAGGSSWDFHLDDNPRQLLKVFIYLNDVYASNAAFRAFDYTALKSFFEMDSCLVRKNFAFELSRS
jgi:hypothetical protein